jgi:hypothetical protein
MSNILKWLLPVTAALAVAFGVSALSARAADAGEGEKKEGKGTVAGTVTDKDGKAVEAVEVRLMKPRQRGGGGGGAGGGAAPQATPPPAVATATTDKDGKFEMKDIPAGEYRVGVRDDAKKVYGRSNVTVEADKTATVEIKCTDTPPQRGGGGGGGGGARPPGGGGGGAGGNEPK